MVWETICSIFSIVESPCVEGNRWLGGRRRGEGMTCIEMCQGEILEVHGDMYSQFSNQDQTRFVVRERMWRALG